MSEVVMVNLSVLSQLRLGERLRCRHGRFFQLYHRRGTGFSLTVPETFLRWWDGSSRHSDFRAVLDVYNTGMNEIAHLRTEKGDVARSTERQLLRRMRESLRGLKILERTYASDVTLVSRIQRLRERVEMCCGVADEPSPTQTTLASSQDVVPEMSLSADAEPFRLDNDYTPTTTS